MQSTTEHDVEVARGQARAAETRLAELEHSDLDRPVDQQWLAEHEQARRAHATAVRKAARLDELLEGQASRAQVRAVVIKASRGELKSMRAGLESADEAVAAAAAGHMAALASLVTAAAARNQAVSAAQSRLHELELDADDAGGQHPDGAIAGRAGVMLGGRAWLAIDAAGLVCRSLRLVFTRTAGHQHPLAGVGKQWPDWQLAGVALPEVPAELPAAAGRVAPRRAQVADMLPAREAGGADVSGYRPAPSGERRTAG